MVHLSYVVQYDIGPYGSWSICLVVHLSHSPIDFGPFVARSICLDTVRDHLILSDNESERDWEGTLCSTKFKASMG